MYICTYTCDCQPSLEKCRKKMGTPLVVLSTNGREIVNWTAQRQTGLCWSGHERAAHRHSRHGCRKGEAIIRVLCNVSNDFSTASLAFAVMQFNHLKLMDGWMYICKGNKNNTNNFDVHNSSKQQLRGKKTHNNNSKHQILWLHTLHFAVICGNLNNLVENNISAAISFGLVSELWPGKKMSAKKNEL